VNGQGRSKSGGRTPAPCGCNDVEDNVHSCHHDDNDNNDNSPAPAAICWRRQVTHTAVWWRVSLVLHMHDMSIKSLTERPHTKPSQHHCLSDTNVTTATTQLSTCQSNCFSVSPIPPVCLLAHLARWVTLVNPILLNYHYLWYFLSFTVCLFVYVCMCVCLYGYGFLQEG